MIGQRLLAAGFIILQAVLIGATSGQRLVPLVACVLAVVAAAWRSGVRLQGWLWNGALLLISFLVLQKCLAHPYSEELTSWVVPAAVTLGLAEYLLVVQACLAFHRREDGGLSTALPVLGIMTTVGVFNRTISWEQQPLYLAMALALTVMAALLFRRGTETRRDYRASDGDDRANDSKQRRLLVAVVLAMAVILGWQISEQMSRNVGLLRPWTYDFGLVNRRRTTGLGYVHDATLHSVTASKHDRPSQVALRVYAARSPGYLRGKVFDTYFGAEWHVNVGSTRGNSQGIRQLRANRAMTALGLPSPANGQEPFALDERGRGPWTSMRMVNDPRRGRVFFTPLGTGYVYGSGARLWVDAHQVVRGGISTGKPYTAFLARERARVVLSPRSREKLLARPDGLDDRVDELAARVGRGKTTPRGKMDAVAAFFQNNFEYALGELRVPNRQEPLTYFLLNRPAAHCEFFASGAIALLRIQGVPCRYVIGYVVDEQGEYGDYWLARNRNAHAWVEAFDDDQQRWVIVEATPGMSAPEEDDDNDQQLADAAGGNDGDDAFGLTPSMFKGAWSLQSLAALGLFVAAAGTVGGFLTIRPEMRDRLLGRLAGRDPWMLTMHRGLRTMDRRMRRRHLTRRADETLHQFAARIRAVAESHRGTKQDIWLEHAAAWYFGYATLRYNRFGIESQRPLPPPLP